ncbi:hypothetical protein EB232_13760 [Mesorhizobium sp. NZP2077]|nr:hypothetical protein EB232_13760 [Mesorhizobium sp. NZP2077]
MVPIAVRDDEMVAPANGIDVLEVKSQPSPAAPILGASVRYPVFDLARIVVPDHYPGRNDVACRCRKTTAATRRPPCASTCLLTRSAVIRSYQSVIRGVAEGG